MAKGKNILITAVGLAAGYMLYRSYNVKKSVELLDYSISSVSLRWSGLTPVLYFKLLIYNPNKTSIPLTDVAGNVLYNNSVAATFQNTQQVNIGANDRASVDMQARLKIGALLSALTSKSNASDVVLKGIMRTSVVDVPFSYNYNPSNS